MYFGQFLSYFRSILARISVNRKMKKKKKKYVNWRIKCKSACRRVSGASASALERHPCILEIWVFAGFGFFLLLLLLVGSSLDLLRVWGFHGEKLGGSSLI